MTESFSLDKALAAQDKLDLALDQSHFGEFTINVRAPRKVRVTRSIVRASGDRKVRSNKISPK